MCFRGLCIYVLRNFWPLKQQELEKLLDSLGSFSTRLAICQIFLSFWNDCWEGNLEKSKNRNYSRPLLSPCWVGAHQFLRGSLPVQWCFLLPHIAPTECPFPTLQKTFPFIKTQDLLKTAGGNKTWDSSSSPGQGLVLYLFPHLPSVILEAGY